MKIEYEKQIEDSVNNWVWDLIDSLSISSTTAFAAGTFHAGGKLGKGISWDTAKKRAFDYMSSYREGLASRGVLTVSNPVYKDGVIVKWVKEEVGWMKDMAATIKSEIMGIIEGGLGSGSELGIVVGDDGKYLGGIAKVLQDYTEKLNSRVSTIAETEVHRSYSNGMKDEYSREGVMYVQWKCMAGACDNCVPLDGRVFRMGEEPDLVHPNCHCECVPYEMTLDEVIHGV